MSSAQVPDGYKQTEVGVIPEDWEVSYLEAVSKLSSGTTPSRAQEDRYYRNGEFHWVKTTDLNNSQIKTTEEKVTREALDETCLQVYPSGTVLVAMYGGFNQIGRTGLISVPAAVNQALIAIQAKSNKLDPAYLLATLNYRVEHWKSVASSSRKDPNITSQDVKNFVLALPKIQEQRSLAQALSDVDTLIASLDKLIAKQRHLKTAAMQQLLTGKMRLPGFGEGKGYKQTEVGVIPEDWEVKTIGEDALTYSGGTPSTSNLEYYYGEIPWITSGDLNQRYISEIDGRISAKGLNNSSAKMIPKNTLLIALYGATAGVSAISKIEAAINQAVLAILPKKLDTHYLFCIFELTKDQIIETYTQGGQPNLSGEIIRSLPIAAPKGEEQRAIATVLSDMDTAIAALENRRAKTQAIKQGMMQELLTGRTRLI